MMAVMAVAAVTVISYSLGRTKKDGEICIAMKKNISLWWK